MYFLTTISKWQGVDSGRRVHKGASQYLINPSSISEIISVTGGTRVLFCDNYSNARSGMSYFWCNSTVDEIRSAADQPISSLFYTVDVFHKNNPAKSTYSLNFLYDSLICAWASAANANYTWIVYQDGNSTRKVLANKVLNEILDDAMKYASTINLSAGINTVVTTTLTVVPYSVQLLDSSGNDISGLLVSITLSGGVYVLTFYSVDALTGCKLYILY